MNPQWNDKQRRVNQMPREAFFSVGCRVHRARGPNRVGSENGGAPPTVALVLEGI